MVGLRVLLVDDDALTRKAARTTLESHLESPLIDEADSGEAALDRLAGPAYDLVISDHHMKAVSGIEVLMAARDRQPLARRILLSGRADLELAIDAIDRARIHGFLDKPLTTSDFRERLIDVVQKTLSRPLM